MAESTGLPIIFVCLMGLAVLVYAILDGYDLGVGMLLPIKQHENLPNPEHQRDIMIASIGPFWDANETWLVLAVGILLIAFPSAYNLVLMELYLPSLIMLCGLILRGVAFDFRTKSSVDHKLFWDRTFKLGSFIAASSQGYMLGKYVLGFEKSMAAEVFACISAICVTAAYIFNGAAWLVLKTDGDLQKYAAKIGRRSGVLTAIGILLVSFINLYLDNQIQTKWLGFPQVFLLIPIPLVCAGLFIICDRFLRSIIRNEITHAWVPFACVTSIFFLCFNGLAYSYFPYIIPRQITIWESASATESLEFILAGCFVVIPAIIGYTFFAYRVFWGKATLLHYH